MIFKTRVGKIGETSNSKRDFESILKLCQVLDIMPWLRWIVVTECISCHGKRLRYIHLQDHYGVIGKTTESCGISAFRKDILWNGQKYKAWKMKSHSGLSEAVVAMLLSCTGWGFQSVTIHTTKKWPAVVLVWAQHGKYAVLKGGCLVVQKKPYTAP